MRVGWGTHEDPLFLLELEAHEVWLRPVGPGADPRSSGGVSPQHPRGLWSAGGRRRSAGRSESQEKATGRCKRNSGFSGAHCQ